MSYPVGAGNQTQIDPLQEHLVFLAILPLSHLSGFVIRHLFCPYKVTLAVSQVFNFKGVQRIQSHQWTQVCLQGVESHGNAQDHATVRPGVPALPKMHCSPLLGTRD